MLLARRGPDDLEEASIHTGFMSRPEVSRIETSLIYSFARSGLPVAER